MQEAIVGVVLAVIAAAGEVPMTAPDAWRALRPESAAVRTLMARGMEQSGTFRELTDRLSRADVLVYVRFSRCPGEVAGCLFWASAGPGVRRVLIKLDQFGRSPNELTALLAHELQHALEVADTPEIRDLASFQKAFTGRGWKGAHGFETTQAGDVRTRVAAELGSPREAANGQSREPGPRSKPRTRTVVGGDVDAGQLRQLDAFVLSGSRVIFLRRQSQTFRAAEYEGGPYVLILAVVIWHEMTHAEGLDERQAEEREEALWKAFTVRGLVDSAGGQTYLAELQRRR